MRLALEESRRALPGCYPNPPVGCVVVEAGKIVSTGFTQQPGGPHAEAMALSQLSEDASELTVFTTLEPCSFDGRTPSCARALAARGVRLVIVGILDPHPRNRGAGVRILEEAGIATECGVLESEISRFLDPYLIRE